MTNEDEIIAKQFFQAAWQNHAENYIEKENKVARELKVYNKIKTEAKNYPELMKILTDLENASIRYLQVVDALAKAKFEKKNNRIILEYETARKLAHNVCIDGLNLLSRQFRAAGLDNEWRREIGLDRDLIGYWARAVGEYLINTKIDTKMEEYKDDPARV